MIDRSLVARYGSPLIIYELRAVQSAHRDLREALPEECGLCYSFKANPHPEIVRELQGLGCLAEVSSIGEMQVALEAGFDPKRILYTGPGKTYHEILAALENRVSLFSVDSPGDIHKVADAAQATLTPAEIILRVNADQPITGLGMTMTGIPSQFGADASWILRNPEDFKGNTWTQLVGFHFYMGTQINAIPTLLETFKIGILMVDKLCETLGVTPKVVDLGGGFGHPFAVKGHRPRYAELRKPLEVLLDRHLPGWRDGAPQVIFESGRYLVARSGTLLCTVQDVKRSKDRTYVVLDSGINHLGGMSGLRRLPRIVPDLIPAGTRTSRDRLERVEVVGPLCTPLDTWAKGIDTPQFAPGDIVAIPNVGAYGLTSSLIAFLSRECPVEIILDGDNVCHASQISLVRRVAKEQISR